MCCGPTVNFYLFSSFGNKAKTRRTHKHTHDTTHLKARSLSTTAKRPLTRLREKSSRLGAGFVIPGSSRRAGDGIGGEKGGIVDYTTRQTEIQPILAARGKRESRISRVLPSISSGLREMEIVICERRFMAVMIIMYIPYLCRNNCFKSRVQRPKWKRKKKWNWATNVHDMHVSRDNQLPL